MLLPALSSSGARGRLPDLIHAMLSVTDSVETNEPSWALAAPVLTQGAIMPSNHEEKLLVESFLDNVQHESQAANNEEKGGASDPLG